MRSFGVFQKMDISEPFSGGHRREFYSVFATNMRRTTVFATPNLPSGQRGRTSSKNYINDRHLPDKAIDVLDEAGGQVNDCFRHRSGRKRLVLAILKPLFLVLHGFQRNRVSRNDQSMLKQLDRNLKMVVFGQDQAIDSLVSAQFVCLVVV